MTPEELKAIEDRMSAATPGPWLVHVIKTILKSADPSMSHNQINDSEFISHARTDIPVLIAEVKRLREALESIADPRKREHKEPDSYTSLGCVMNIADIALRG